MDRRAAFELLIEKYLKGIPLTIEERELLDSYFDAFEYREDILERLPNEHIDRIRKELSLRILDRVPDATEPQPAIRTAPRWNAKWYIGLAASVLLVVGIAYFSFMRNPREVNRTLAYAHITSETYHRSGDSTMQVRLPDGSLIQLNKESELYVSDGFEDGIRHVSLIGEGYFDIAPDTDRPFVVRCGDMEIKVLGTKFIAKSEAGDHSVGLVSGKVALALNAQRMALAPGEFASQTAAGKLEKIPVDIASLMRWKPDGFELADVTMAELTDFMAKRYGLQFAFADSAIQHCHITHTWTGDETWEEVLSMVALVNRFEYTITGNRIVISGSGCVAID